MELNRASYENKTTNVDLAQNNDSYDGVEDEKENSWGSFADSSFVLALYGVICVVGIAGNLLVCVVLLRVPSLRSNTSDFLVHLSIVDFLVCLLVIPSKLVPPSETPVPNPGFFGEVWCRLYGGQYLFYVCVLVSVLCLVTVNLERFVAIVYPHKYKVMFTRRNKILIIAVCWFLGAVSKFFILFLFDEDVDDGCRFMDWPNPAVQAAVGLYTFIIQLPLPFTLMIVAQWKVILTLKKQVRMLAGPTGSSTLNPADQHKMWQLRTTQTLIKTLLTFVITFAVCWTPVQLVFLVYNFGAYVDFSSPVYHVGIILAVCNSCVNPIIYTLMNQRFRKGIREAFCPRGKSTRVGDRSTEIVSLSLNTNR
ncbi:neuromedin-U receptor 2-like [Asterias amurensis]|uniref:neuromedin-U receptor 2-like n=1 Tax=Asterias amurensis TaxID=7602 RepID=UPI003AB1FF05